MRRYLVTLVLTAVTLGCGPFHRPEPPQAVPDDPATSPVATGEPRNGMGEDPFCDWIFTESDTPQFARVLSEASATKPCSLDGIQVQYTRAVATWLAPDRQKVSMSFQSGRCGSPEKAPGTPLIAVGVEEVRRVCPENYDAAVAAMAAGRLPAPQQRPDEVKVMR